MYRAQVLLIPVILASNMIGVSPPRPAGAAPVTTYLTGAGSTFAAPFLGRVLATYERSSPVRITYRAIGSGAGIQQFIANKLDFAVSDTPMNLAERAQALGTGGPVAQLPVLLGSVAVSYNLPGLRSGPALRLDGPTLAAIFAGELRRWDDPAIARLNPGVRLPGLDLLPVHRADSSGTTYIFTDYLSAVSTTWQRRVGRGKLVAWPAGLGGTKTSGVAAAIIAHPGAIGYGELNYMVNTSLPLARLRNRAGSFVGPMRAAVQAAAAAFPYVDADHFSIVDAPGATSYPIAGYSWALVRAHQTNREQGRGMLDLLRWIVTTAQGYATALNYVPMPAQAQAQALHLLHVVRAG